MTASLPSPWNKMEFEARLRALGHRYHIHHPFHVRMNEGGASKAELQGWVANRFYYQTRIPIKDAAIMANCDDLAIRKAWIQRILDHDGYEGHDGGIEAWLRLGDAVGLEREELLDHRHVLPSVRFACDAYVTFARTASWQEAVCSSLTELFAPQAHQQRISYWPEKYPWIDEAGYDYFKKRLKEVRVDVAHGLATTLAHFTTHQQQTRALEIVGLKLDVLWTMLDAMQLAYTYQEPPYHCCPENHLANSH